MLFANKISDPSPLEQLLASGALHELHLSNNEISDESACRLVVAAANAKGVDGKYSYPISGSKPLWLRLENNKFGGEFHVKLSEHLCRAGRPIWKLICFVDGASKCNASVCHSKRECVPGIHLTYMGSTSLNRRQAVKKLSGREAKPKQKCVDLNKPLLASNIWESNGSEPLSVPPMDLINYPLLRAEDKHYIIQGEDSRTAPGYQANTSHLPIHVVSGNYDAENIYCMTARVGDAVLMPDTYDQSDQYKFAVNVNTGSIGWISSSSL